MGRPGGYAGALALAMKFNLGTRQDKASGEPLPQDIESKQYSQWAGQPGRAGDHSCKVSECPGAMPTSDY